jgi:hypothetical protein
MPTMNEMMRQLHIVLFETDKSPAIKQLKRWAAEAGGRVEEFILTFSERNKEVKQEKKPSGQERVEGISYAFTKLTPKQWLDLMKGSQWYNSGCPGLYEEKVDQAKETIDENDAIATSPAMCECTWEEVKHFGRDGFLVIMIKKFQEYNRRNGISV